MRYNARAELRGVLDAVSDAIVIVDEAWRILNTNATCTTLFGYRAHELITQPIGRLFVPRRERKILASIQHTLPPRCGRHTVWQGRLLGRHRDGRTIIIESRIGRYLQNGLIRYVLVLRDVGARRHAERALQRAALRDALTGLVNRAAFADELRRTIERARRADRSFALLLLDLDHFKEINDSAGHQTGDLLLRQVSRRLREQVRQSDVLGRFGGDEFAVILDASKSVIDSIALAERLVKAIGRPFFVAGLEAHIGASAGIATYPQDARAADQLLACADMALYAAKAAGRGSWQLYDVRLQEAATARRLLEEELRVAIRDGQFRLLYQPVVRVSDLEVCGFEALIRWHHPRRGLVTPDDFIPFAERNRLIQPITEWALGRAIDDIATLAPEVIERLPVAVNISTRLFDQDSLVDTVARIRAPRQSELRLILEITEGALAEYDHAADVLREMRRLGVQVAIDDFGMGYSSLARLKGLPLDVLKIDRSFVSSLPGIGVDRAIADSIVRLAGSLGMATVAEGVETLEQLRGVVDLGCSQAQGFLFASPMPSAGIPDWLERWRRHERQRLLDWCRNGTALLVA
jgi:diguanylate cyclase (GGDEF)-like protein/PAS domain S-box-containing protein